MVTIKSIPRKVNKQHVKSGALQIAKNGRKNVLGHKSAPSVPNVSLVSGYRVYTHSFEDNSLSFQPKTKTTTTTTTTKVYAQHQKIKKNRVRTKKGGIFATTQQLHHASS